LELPIPAGAHEVPDTAKNAHDDIVYNVVTTKK